MPSASGKSNSIRKIGRKSYAVINSKDDSIYSGFGSNQGFVILDDSVLIFDSGFSTKDAIALDRAISKITTKRPRYLVNSHDHSDHIFGNSYFLKKYHNNRLQIISHGTCERQIRKLGESRLREYRNSDKKLSTLLARVQISLPNLCYSNSGMEVNIEGTPFLFIHPQNGAHTLGDSVLAAPEEGVMFLGDILFNKFFPNLEDADLESWVDFLGSLDLNSYASFVPGHGEICDGKNVLQFRDYLQTIRDRLLASNSNNFDQSDLESIFETRNTKSWKFRHILRRNANRLITHQIANRAEN